jgi:hypothetical protein
MTGGLMQVVSNTGSGDIYLTGNPHITLYKKVYRRHTHFAVESIEQIYDDRAGTQITTNTRQYSVIISKSGDLINQMFFEIELPQLTTNVSWVYGIGNAYIKKISLSIGGQVIDTLYSDWMNIWGELTTPDGHRETYDEMVGNYSDLSIADNTGQGQRAGLPANAAQRVFVPLPFWFCRNVGQSLPLIALQNAEIKLDFEFRPFNELYVITSGTPTVTEKKINARLWIDYIFLDNDERRRFSQVAHEYLIEQVQWNGGYNVSSGNLTRPVEMQFNHPVKEIIWANISNTHNTVSSDATSYGNSWFNYAKENNNYTDGGYGNDTFLTGRIVLNGQDKITPRDASYFRKVQNYEAHTNIPRTPTYNFTTSNSTIHNPNGAQYIYTYSFGLSPEEHQPTGSCNFSKLDTTYLNLTYNSADVTGGKSYTLNIYVTNYNILRIQGGQGGIAYSN